MWQVVDADGLDLGVHVESGHNRGGSRLGGRAAIEAAAEDRASRLGAVAPEPEPHIIRISQAHTEPGVGDTYISDKEKREVEWWLGRERPCSAAVV